MRTFIPCGYCRLFRPLCQNKEDPRKRHELGLSLEILCPLPSGHPEGFFMQAEQSGLHQG